MEESVSYVTSQIILKPVRMVEFSCVFLLHIIVMFRMCFELWVICIILVPIVTFGGMRRSGRSLCVSCFLLGVVISMSFLQRFIGRMQFDEFCIFGCRVGVRM